MQYQCMNILIIEQINIYTEMGNCIFCIKNSHKNSQMPHLIPLQNDAATFYQKYDLQTKQNKKSIIIKTNPTNMKLTGVPKSWLSKKYCDQQIIDETQMVEEDLSEDGVQENLDDGDLRMSLSNSSEQNTHLDEISNSVESIVEEYQINGSGIRKSDIVINIQGSPKSPSLSKSKSQIETNEIISKLSIDKKEKYGIKNLPEDWINRMEASGLAEEQVKENPQIMLDLIKNDSMMYASKSTVGQQQLITYEQFLQVVYKVEVIYYNPAKQYQLKKRLGSGAMCQVFQAKKKKNTVQQCAVRVMKNQRPQNLPKIQEEIAIMKLCQSDNIVKHIETYFFKNTIYMFIEYMNGGSLTGFIEAYRKKIPEEVISYILREILKGVAVLHKKKRIHRDLKSDNILLSREGQIKIADFGFAAQLTQEKEKRNTIVGTPSWMAPQLILKNSYTQKVDIWSIGVIILELINGEPPYIRLNPFKAMYQITSRAIPSLDSTSYSPQLKNFYLRCMEKNPQNRANCKQLLDHPFLKKVGETNKQNFQKHIKQMR